VSGLWGHARSPSSVAATYLSVADYSDLHPRYAPAMTDHDAELDAIVAMLEESGLV
jgi:hypothetical protein